MKSRLILSLFACSLVVACMGEPEMKQSPVTPEVLAKLAKADAKDGAVDKVVHKCAGCSLGMDGDAKFELKVQDYAMHFCKQECLGRFQGDPAKAIGELTIKD